MFFRSTGLVAFFRSASQRDRARRFVRDHAIVHSPVRGRDHVVHESRLDRITRIQNRGNQFLFRLVVDSREVRTNPTTLSPRHVALRAIVVEHLLAVGHVAAQLHDVAISWPRLSPGRYSCSPAIGATSSRLPDPDCHKDAISPRNPAPIAPLVPCQLLQAAPVRDSSAPASRRPHAGERQDCILASCPESLWQPQARRTPPESRRRPPRPPPEDGTASTFSSTGATASKWPPRSARTATIRLAGGRVACKRILAGLAH